MAETAKSRPSVPPSRPTLRDLVELALRDEAVRKSLRVAMNVRGGLPAQAYRFEFELAGTGEARFQYACRLSKREGKAEKSVLEPRQVLTILKAVMAALDLPDEPPRFLPDTLVGVLEVSDGANTRRFYFAADPDQAKSQGKVPPAALTAAINAIYASAAKLAGQRSVKP